MIRRLYREYRLQIIFAFFLVILENFAYVAEPFVFGKAIDGLREAHRVEEEVDSSLSGIQARQIADSVRSHILDSLRLVDSLKRIQEFPTAAPGQQQVPPIEQSSFNGTTGVPKFYFASFRSHTKK